MVKGKKVEFMQSTSPQWLKPFQIGCLATGLQVVGPTLMAAETAVAQSLEAPPPLVEAPSSVVDELRTTGVLKVAIRSDSPIFGYIDDNRQWTGYCFDVVEAIETSLEAMETMPSDIEVLYVPSSLGNRYELVQSGFVALECGPNTIRDDIEGVTFSVPFFYTGTQLLVSQDNAALLATNPTLAGTPIGVAAQTTNEAFLQQRFPEANLIPFESSQGGTVGLQGLNDGNFEAYASDSVLLRAALANSKLPEAEYQLIPAQPLTCDSYGLMLPANDEEWQRTIGTLLQREPQLSIQENWLGEYYPLELATLEYCLGVQGPVAPPLS